MSIITLLIYLVIGVLVMGFAWWVVGQFTLPPPVQKGAYIVLGLIGLIFLIWILLSFVGGPHPLGLPR